MNYTSNTCSLDKTTNQLQSFLATHKEHVEKTLDELLPEPTSSADTLSLAMRYSALNNAGKRLRPILVYATGLALGANLNALHIPAASIELIHCYSLIHDDLPAMDNDDLRRGLPTCHKAFNEAIAILAGDALQCLAFSTLARYQPKQVAIQLLQVLTNAAGTPGMILGQALDLAAENKNISLEQLIQIHSNKTGALLQACVEMAISINNFNTNDNNTSIQGLKQYGYWLGLAFQAHDDILDATSDSQTLGKTAKLDQINGKSTFVSLLGLEQAQAETKKYYNKAIAALAPLQDKAKMLKQLAKYFIERSN